ncbi:MAG TPA: hypothetical protein VNZ46_14935, partial [Pedobacter sp.]|nr:hypothetical protein [Pedobacter sp.]
RNRFKKGVRNAIDMHFHGKKHLSLEGLEQALKKQGISVVLRKNPTGQIYGITFVDHINKCVFNGRTLGPGYSIKSIQEKCEPTKVSLRPSTHVEVREVNIETNRRERRSNFGKFEPKQVSTKPKRKYDFSKTENIRPPFSMLNGYTSLGQPHHSPHGASDSKEGIFTILFEAYETDSQLPPELRASKSKKRYKKKRS